MPLSAPHYSIMPYLLHMQGLVALLDTTLANKLEEKIERLNELDPLSRKLFIDKVMVEHAITLIRERCIPPLEELLFSGTIEQGQLTTFHRPIYFKGASNALEKERKGKKAYAEFHSKLLDFNGILVKGLFSPEHFTYSSSVTRLSGRGTRFILAIVDQLCKNGDIILRPILIGDRIYDNVEKVVALHSGNEYRIFAEDIDEFSRLAPLDFKKWDLNDLNILRNIPERQVKKWFAQILNEGNVPKDWGGETCDLFTNHIHIKGERTTGAFLLKGPAKFHKLTSKDLGANGDQIVRLFTSPANIFIVQHCHYIAPEILHQLDAFASRQYRSKRYCTLDGVDTLRILIGYGYITL